MSLYQQTTWENALCTYCNKYNPLLFSPRIFYFERTDSQSVSQHLLLALRTHSLELCLWRHDISITIKTHHPSETIPVTGSAYIFSGVMALKIRYIHHHKAKVRHRFNAWWVSNGLAIVEPLHFEVWISYRDQCTFKVGWVSIFQTL